MNCKLCSGHCGGEYSFHICFNGLVVWAHSENRLSLVNVIIEENLRWMRAKCDTVGCSSILTALCFCLDNDLNSNGVSWYLPFIRLIDPLKEPCAFAIHRRTHCIFIYMNFLLWNVISESSSFLAFYNSKFYFFCRSLDMDALGETMNCKQPKWRRNKKQKKKNRTTRISHKLKMRITFVGKIVGARSPDGHRLEKTYC